MNTLQYFQENDGLTEAGYTFGQSMSDFVDEAIMADYTCDDGDNLQEAVDAFWAHANTIPEKMRDRRGLRRMGRGVQRVLPAEMARGRAWRLEEGLTISASSPDVHGLW